MSYHSLCLMALYVLAGAAVARARTVNISNTWVLPQEGFPVFYRYFRDRITWYEADAVCQFHHGNLVTVDTSEQYDTTRAFLKELDVVDNVWLGLKRTADNEPFLWTDTKPVQEGYFLESPPISGSPLCVTTDPSHDFRWHSLSCGGPSVASFVCELEVPNWAQKEDGCMLTSLPSLTITYLPELVAVEMISDCGLDGTRRIACRGQANREEMIRQLTCDEKDSTATPQSVSSNEPSQDTEIPTRHRRDAEDATSSLPEQSETTTIITSIVEHLVADDRNATQVYTTEIPNKISVKNQLSRNSTEKSGVPPKIVSIRGYMDVPTQSLEDTYRDPIIHFIPVPNEKIYDGEVDSINPCKHDCQKISLTTAQSTNEMTEETITTHSNMSLTNTRFSTNIPDEKVDTAQINEITTEKILYSTPIPTTDIPSSPNNISTATEKPLSNDEMRFENNTGNSTYEYLQGPVHGITSHNNEEQQNVTSTNVDVQEQEYQDIIETEPEVPTRPNRGRRLVRPRSRSFYPYFLNRVLG